MTRSAVLQQGGHVAHGFPEGLDRMNVAQAEAWLERAIEVTTSPCSPVKSPVKNPKKRSIDEVTTSPCSPCSSVDTDASCATTITFSAAAGLPGWESRHNDSPLIPTGRSSTHGLVPVAHWHGPLFHGLVPLPMAEPCFATESDANLVLWSLRPFDPNDPNGEHKALVWWHNNRFPASPHLPILPVPSVFGIVKLAPGSNRQSRMCSVHELCRDQNLAIRCSCAKDVGDVKPLKAFRSRGNVFGKDRTATRHITLRTCIRRQKRLGLLQARAINRCAAALEAARQRRLDRARDRAASARAHNLLANRGREPSPPPYTRADLRDVSRNLLSRFQEVATSNN